jgi:HlyD family secretion protein
MTSSAKLSKIPNDVTSTQERDDALESLLDTHRKKGRFRRILLLVLISVIIAGVGFGVYRWKQGEAKRQLPKYVTEPIAKGELTSTISATGTVEALNTVEVGAEISGRILSLNADFNDTVSVGQILAEIDPEQHKAAVAQAKAQVLAANAHVAESKATLIESKQESERAKALFAKGLVAPKEMESAEAKTIRAEASLKSAKASAAVSKANFDAARSNLNKTEIVSPINGTVLSREVEVGQAINAGMQTPVLFVIAENLKRMRLSSLVDEADIGKVLPGQSATFTVDAYPGREFTSSVTSVRNVPQTDQNVVAYEVLLSVDNQQLLLKPGMTASVEIVTEKLKDVLLVANKAFRFSPNRDDMGFRGGPMLFMGRRNRSKSSGSMNHPEKKTKLTANQGLLWMIDKNGPPGAVRSITVDKLASDGNRTAIESDEATEGLEVIIEQAIDGFPKP